MTGSTEDRLLDQLDQHLIDSTGGAWEITRGTFDHQVLSPVEPCNLCGQKVFLLLPHGRSKPVWLQFAGPKGMDTLFPVMRTKRHTCGDGDSWSGEAALFVDSALAEWGIQP